MPFKLTTSVALGVGVAVALTAFAAQHGAPIATQVAGAPLGGDGLRSSTTAAGRSETKAGGKAQAPKLTGPLTGDAVLAGLVDLSAMERVGERYELPLPDGRRAVLTLDPAIQTAAETVLSRAKAPRGAIVVTA